MRSSRHSSILETVGRIDEERATLEHELAELPERIRRARVEAFRAAPTQATDGDGTEVRRLVDRQEEATRKLVALEAEREAALTVEAEEAAKKQALVARQLVAKAETIRASELDGWAEAGQAFAALAAIWTGTIVPRALELEQVRDEARRQGIDPDAVAELTPPIAPWPANFWGCLTMLYAAGYDPGSAGRRLVHEPTAARSDRDRILPTFVTDLRPDERVSLRNVESREVAFRG